MYFTAYIMTDRRYWKKPLTEKELYDIINGDDSELDNLDIDEDDYPEDRDIPSRGKWRILLVIFSVLFRN